jgi:hypothetical protein
MNEPQPHIHPAVRYDGKQSTNARRLSLSRASLWVRRAAFRGASIMLNKILLCLAALFAAFVALPAAAEARGRHHGYYDGYHGRGYYDRGYYRRGYYDRGYYPRRYRGRHHGYYRRHRCGSGTTGAIIGGAAGALLGREIARGRRDYYGYRRGNGTTGAILGGAVGALVGREIGRRC